MYSSEACIYLQGLEKPSTRNCSVAAGGGSYLRNRELGYFSRKNYQRQTVYPTLYSYMRPRSHMISDDNGGSVFGLDFSVDGKILAAAMERRSISLFDPLSHGRIASISGAHHDCINTIKFLDTRLFASGSDDKLVKLWDIRFPTSAVRTFGGHTNWVKNVDYDQRNGFLLSSGFDGHVYAWDINHYNGQEIRHHDVFFTPGLLRSVLSPDGSKLIMSTQWGYILVVHDFDLKTCGEDLKDFKPNLYWLMIKSGSKFMNSDGRLHYFESKRNKAELILDFPDQNDPDNITSLAVHPHSWCVLSRNTNHDEKSDWTCVHDIQLPAIVFEEESVNNELDTKNAQVTNKNSSDESHNSNTTTSISSGRSIIAIEMQASTIVSNAMESVSFVTTSFTGDRSTTYDAGDINAHTSSEESSYSSSSIDERVDSIHDSDNELRTRTVHRTNAEPHAIFLPQDPLNPQQRLVLIVPQRNASNWLSNSASSRCKTVDQMPKIYQRLLCYSEEPNVGRGFIKEQSFSADGRLIASPHGSGVRLLAFSSDFKELCDCDDLACLKKNSHGPSRPKISKLVPTGVTLNPDSSKIVLCTKFSPTHLLLASGCLGGNVSFHQPVL